eukprot:m.90683 g.90683  ORF g.90683 m.90683 type:complete len:72 (-) comp15275_c0_seq1:23-238(-)
MSMSMITITIIIVITIIIIISSPAVLVAATTSSSPSLLSNSNAINHLQVVFTSFISTAAHRSNDVATTLLR